MITAELIGVLIAALLGSSFLTQWLQNRGRRVLTAAESVSTSVTAAQDAVETISAVIEPLKVEIRELHGQVTELREANTRLTFTVGQLQRANQQLTTENERLTVAVTHLKRLVSEAMNGERLHALLGSTSDGVLIEAPNRVVSQCNQRFCDVWGIPVPPEDLTGLDCATSARQLDHLIPDVDQFLTRVDELLAGGVPVIGEPITLLDGRTIYRTFVPITHTDGSREIAWIYHPHQH